MLCRLIILALILIAGAAGHAQNPYPYQSTPTQYPQQGSPGQADPSVTGSSSLTPGQYVLTNLATGRQIYVTITPTGQMYTQDAPAAQSPAPQFAPPAQQPQFAQPLTQSQFAQPVQQMQQATPQQAQGSQSQQPSKMGIVGSALRGALGMYYQRKYGSMMGGYPTMGGYPSTYPMGGYPTSYPSAMPNPF